MTLLANAVMMRATLQPETVIALVQMNSPYIGDDATALDDLIITVKESQSLTLGINNLGDVFDAFYASFGPNDDVGDYGINLVPDRFSNLSKTGTVNFDSADGVDMGSAAARLNSNVNPVSGTQFTKDDGTLGVFITSLSVSSSEQFYFGSRSASATTRDRFRFSREGNKYVTWCFDASDADLFTTPTTGLVACQRDNSSDYTRFIDGTTDVETSASQTEQSKPTPYGNYDSEGSFTKPMLDTSSIYFAGNGSVDMATLNTNLKTYFGI